jgi:hypothetical protein
MKGTAGSEVIKPVRDICLLFFLLLSTLKSTQNLRGGQIESGKNRELDNKEDITERGIIKVGIIGVGMVEVGIK